MNRTPGFSMPVAASRRPGPVHVALGFALLAILLGSAGCGSKRLLSPDVTTSGAGSSLSSASASLVRSGGLEDGEGTGRGQALHREGRLEDGSMWVIDAPANWNRDLIVYCHGYVNPADPVALPSISALRDSLLARGFAVAASSYASNGFAVPEGVRDSRALSDVFERFMGEPRRTFLMGQSLGGLVGMLLEQRYPERYDGSLLISGIVGGSLEEVQYMGDIRALFDAVYPGVLAGDLEHPPVITNINAQVVGPVVQAVTANPQGLGIIQALARRKLPGNNANEIVTSLVNMLGFAMQGGGDLFARTNHQSYFDNAGWTYTSPQLPQPLIDGINARVARYTRSAEAAAFLARWGTSSGPFRRPVATLHNMRDPVVPYFHEQLLALNASGSMLVQHATDTYGHANFTTGELVNELVQVIARAPARGRELAWMAP